MGQAPEGTRLARIRESPQYDRNQERFVNELGHGSGDWTKIVGQAIANEAKTRPDEALPTDETLSERLREPPPQGLRISWIGHSTMLIEIDGYRLLTDPMFSERASPVDWAGPLRFGPPALSMEELPPLDAVLISHDHYDHLDMDSIRTLDRPGLLFFVPLGVGAHLEYWGVPAERIHELDWWQEARLGELRLACLPSRHFSGRGLFNRYSTLWASWAILGPDHRVYFSGDTSQTPDFLEIGERYGPFDIALIESAAYNYNWADSHLGPEQAIDAFLMVRGKLMVPIHWGTFDLAMHSWTEPVERLRRAAITKNVALVIPRPGNSIEPDTPPTTEPWWPQIPWQTANEAPVVSSNLPDFSVPPPEAPVHPRPRTPSKSMGELNETMRGSAWKCLSYASREFPVPAAAQDPGCHRRPRAGAYRNRCTTVRPTKEINASGYELDRSPEDRA